MAIAATWHTLEACFRFLLGFPRRSNLGVILHTSVCRCVKFTLNGILQDLEDRMFCVLSPLRTVLDCSHSPGFQDGASERDREGRKKDELCTEQLLVCAACGGCLLTGEVLVTVILELMLSKVLRILISFEPYDFLLKYRTPTSQIGKLRCKVLEV